MRGTTILTDAGEVAVKDLRPGDRLPTLTGLLRPSRWIGTQSFDGRFVAADRTPVRIVTGALADNVPHRDLIVLPDHCMALAGRLVAAWILVNGITIRHEPTGGQIDYFHIDLGEHSCILAENTRAESYQDAGNRCQFHNHAASGIASNPMPACLPHAGADDPALPAIRASIAARIPARHFDDDADHWCFTLPAGVGEILLTSRATSAAVPGHSNDDRRTGIAVRQIIARQDGGTLTLDASHPALIEGFHQIDSDGGLAWRWTDGCARLPDFLLGDRAQPVTMIVRGSPRSLYLRPA